MEEHRTAPTATAMHFGEQRYRTIVELASEGIWAIDADAVTTFVNPAMARMLGYEPAEMVGRSLFAFLDDRGTADAIERLDRRRRGIAEQRADHMLVHRDGRPIWTMLSATPLTGHDGEYAGSLALVTDITERIEAEQALITSERRFRAVVQNASDVVNITNVDGVMTYTSPSMERVLGYAPDELIGTQAREIMHPDDVERVEQSVAEQWTTGREEPIEYRVRHRDGSWRSVEALITNLFDEPVIAGVVGTMRDITERKEAEAALAATRERFSALARHATDLVTVSRADGVLEYVSPSVQEVLGYAPHEIEGTDSQLLLHPDDASAIADAVTAHVVAGSEPPHLTYRVRHRDGSWRTLEGITTNLLDEPSVQGVVTNSRDVTERRAAEQKAAQLTEILEASNEVVVLSEPSGHVVYANQTARRLLGPHDDQHVSELSSPASRKRLRGEIMPVVRRTGLWSGELELLGPGGTHVPVAATIQAHRDEAGEIELIATIAHDISELKAAQERLEHEATHDNLTGLPNRALFREIGERALARSERAAQEVAVLFLDLDGFKLVNDGYGHDTGDRLLAQVAQRLRETLRLGDTLARLGGDEFVVLCEQPNSEDQLLDLSRRLIEVVSRPFSIDDDEVRVGASIGIAYGGDTQSGIGGMIREADIAMYRAKHEGRGRAELFEKSLIEP